MKKQKQRWFRVVLEWKLESQGDGEGTRYAFVTKAGAESVAIFAAVNYLNVDATLDVGDTIRVLSCDPHAYQRKHDELEEVP